MIEPLPLDSRPPKRDFIEINPPPDNVATVLDQFRVLQFNVLADGLSGLREDLGAFSRAKRDFLTWSYRKARILHEITQYNPDIITLQECDHFHDFFSPELNTHGYTGFFSPKPASACREVSDQEDGCALFFKTDKFQLIESVTIPYTVPDEAGGPRKKQNQVALLVSLLSQTGGPALLVGTTHLKASKTEEGEHLRLHEAQQLLEEVRGKLAELNQLHGSSVSLITGDLNACPLACSPLGFRCSVYGEMRASRD
eukprot:gene35924-43572_t